MQRGKPLAPSLLSLIQQLVLDGMSAYKIAEKLGISHATVYDRFGDLIKIVRKGKVLIKYERIKESYLEFREISKVVYRLGVSEKTVKDALDHFEIKQLDVSTGNQHARKRDLWEDFFSTIDTEVKAYWLGFLYADGCVSLRRNPKRQTSVISAVQVSAAEQDGHMLRELSQLLYKKDECRLYVYKNRSVTTQNKIYLTINSKRMVEDLIKLGCTQRKSLTLQFPTSDQVPDLLIRHFIRGYFDGDGSVGTYDQGRQCNIVSSHDFCLRFSDKMTDMGIKSRISRPKPDAKYSLVHISAPHIPSFGNMIYAGATIFLARKKTRIDEIIAYYET